MIRKLRHRFIRIALIALTVAMLLILFGFFSPIILTIGILLGVTGAFLLWRRIVDLGKILKEKKRKAKLLLKQALAELGEWRKTYKEADSLAGDMISAIERF